MGTMVAVAVGSVFSGERATKVRGATRDVLAEIRRARSTALITQSAAVITFSNERSGEVNVAKVEVKGENLIGDTKAIEAETIEGTKVTVAGDEMLAEKINAPIPAEVMEGVKIMVVMGEEGVSASESAGEKKSGVSVFSNVDYLIGKYTSESSGTEVPVPDSTVGNGGQGTARPTDSTAGTSAVDEDLGTKSVVWEANGRTDPHLVYIYGEDGKPENGLCIKVDKFGGIKVVDKDDE